MKTHVLFLAGTLAVSPSAWSQNDPAPAVPAAPADTAPAIPSDTVIPQPTNAPAATTNAVVAPSTSEVNFGSGK